MNQVEQARQALVAAETKDRQTRQLYDEVVRQLEALPTKTEPLAGETLADTVARGLRTELERTNLVTMRANLVREAAAANAEAQARRREMEAVEQSAATTLQQYTSRRDAIGRLSALLGRARAARTAAAALTGADTLQAFRGLADAAQNFVAIVDGLEADIINRSSDLERYRAAAAAYGAEGVTDG